MRINKIHALAFCCGLLSLSVEIFWVRFIGYAWQGAPQSFGFVLSAFLVGIALGAWAGKKLCESQPDARVLLRQSVWWVALAAWVILLAPLAYAWFFGAVFMAAIAFVLVAATSFCLSVMFPVVHHVGVQNSSNHSTSSELGKHFSGVYCANVAGAALGPLICGYLLFWFLPLQQVLLFLAVATCLVALVYLAISGASKVHLALMGLSFIAAVFLVQLSLPAHWLLQSVDSRKDQQPIDRLIETRQGIVSVYAQRTGDIVYGGNIFDGTSNLDLEINSNGLQRPLLNMALHPRPKRALMIGLSIGSWLAVVREFPGLEHIDVVEINPGYVQAIESYPAQLAALKDPRVKLHVQDARRWVRQHPNEKYDLIFMNTTFHWRSNTTLLLSKEFLQILKTRLNAQGLISFNATGSMDAFATAHAVFPVARRYYNFIYAADWDFTPQIKTAQALEKYERFTLAGQPAFKPNTKRINEFLNTPFVTLQEDEKFYQRKAEVITDRNMISEFKFGRK